MNLPAIFLFSTTLLNIIPEYNQQVIPNPPLDLQLFLLEQFLEFQELFNSLKDDSALVNSKCLQDVSNFLGDVPKGELWTLQMLDAFAKPQSSILTGNIMHVGGYDECLGVENLENGVNGKYCTVPMKIMNADYTAFFKSSNETLPKVEEAVDLEAVPMFRDFLFQLKSSYGMCIPSSCNSTHMSAIWAAIKDKFQTDIFKDRGLFFNDDYCLDKDSNGLSTEATVAIVIFGLIAAILILSTMYDLIYTQNVQGTEPSILTAFSLYRNGKRLFSKSSSESQLGCMNGLRVVSMMWILFMHRVAISAFLPSINAADILELKEKYYSIPIFASHFAVDTFFAVSGILLSYTYLNKREKSSDNWTYFYIHRYLRLTPSLAAIILMTATLTRHFGDGPFWPIVDQVFQKPCAFSWWVDLLYLQNYIEVEHRCVTQAWYLAVDTQLYALSPILLIPLIKFPKWTIIFSILLTLIGVGLNFTINYIHNFSANFFEQDDDYQNMMYIPTHTRYGPWLIGFIFGYILYKCKHKKVYINKMLVVSLWIISLIIIFVIVYINYYFLNQPQNRIGTSFYNGICRQLWGLAMCWVIFACAHGYGGFVNKFLSLPIFNTAIRINYAMYLVHFEILAVIIVRTRTSGYFSLLQISHQFYGDLFVTFIVSVLWTLSFESPVVILEKLLLRKRSSNRNTRDNRTQQSQDTTVSITVTNNQKVR